MEPEPDFQWIEDAFNDIAGHLLILFIGLIQAVILIFCSLVLWNYESPYDQDQLPTDTVP